jgi:hypothetical protein
MTKSFLVKTTFRDLRDTTLICIPFELFLEDSVSGARKPKVSNANDIKVC